MRGVPGNLVPPCERLAPVLAELAAGHAGQLTVVSVDVDANPGITRRYGVMSTMPRPAQSGIDP